MSTRFKNAFRAPLQALCLTGFAIALSHAPAWAATSGVDDATSLVYAERQAPEQRTTLSLPMRGLLSFPQHKVDAVAEQAGNKVVYWLETKFTSLGYFSNPTNNHMGFILDGWMNWQPTANVLNGRGVVVGDIIPASDGRPACHGIAFERWPSSEVSHCKPLQLRDGVEYALSVWTFGDGVGYALADPQGTVIAQDSIAMPATGWWIRDDEGMNSAFNPRGEVPSRPSADMALTSIGAVLPAGRSASVVLRETSYGRRPLFGWTGY